MEEHVLIRLSQHAYYRMSEIEDAVETLQLRQRQAHHPELSETEIEEILLLAVEVAAAAEEYTLSTAALAVLAWRNFELGIAGQ